MAPPAPPSERSAAPAHSEQQERQRPIDPPAPPGGFAAESRPVKVPSPPADPDPVVRETPAYARAPEPEQEPAVGGDGDESHVEAPESRKTTAHIAIGEVLQIAGSSSRAVLDPKRLAECAGEFDPSVRLAGLVGSQIKVRVGQIWLLASVRTQSLDRATGEIIAEIDFLGEGQEEKLTGRIRNFTRGITHYPVPGAEVFAATNADLAQVYASDGRANIQIGKVFPTKDIRAGLYIDAMLGKHFALLGSTGTGKSTSAALILHRIVEAAPEGHIMMIDPHGEYSAAFRGTGQILDVGNLKVPYWLMNFEEHCEVFVTNKGTDRQSDLDILSKCLLKARAKNRMADQMSRLTVDSPIPYLLSDLTNAIQDEMGRLDKATNTAPFLRVKTKIEEIKADPRYQFMFSGMLVADTMSEVIQRLFRMPSNGKPISIIDVSGVPSEITSTVVAMLSRMVFDFAIWGRDEKTRPILLVCEEAHRYVPNEKNADSSSVGRILSRIAKEGRKYGISLGLITQRPSDLAEGVLSQCGTILAMRLNNERDQDFVKAAMPEGARGFLDTIPALRNRECIVCGEGTAIPMRVTFDDLDEHKRPASEDPSFSELWNESGGEEEAVDRIVTRWRAQHR
ncbi:helicase HerA domain-containing protein [Croceicoccus ponticola]|uniref:ATP-binding protein n=1 Tax=Croceicoccus ponticola TaxID=2217664 RepID=UPI003B831019